MSPKRYHCSTPRAASDRGESVILGGAGLPRQAERRTLLEATAPPGFDVALDVEQALFAGLQELLKLLLEDRIGAFRQLALFPAPAPIRARQDRGRHSDPAVP